MRAFFAHSFYLQQQTLLQRACTNAGRVHVLQHFEHVFNLRFAHIEVMIDSQFVADGIQIFAQEAVIVKTSNEIFHHSILLFSQCEHVHLLLQLVIKRGCVTINRLFIVGIIVIVCIGSLRHNVVFPNIFQGSIQRILTLFSLVYGVKVVAIFVFRISILPLIVGQSHGRIVFFEGGIIVEFSIDVLFKFGQWHLQQMHLQHLLL